MSESYIYPQWLLSVRKLREALCLNTQQNEILTEWFRSYVFEVGTDFKISAEMMNNGTIEEIKYYTTKQSIHKIAEMIVDNGLYMLEKTMPGYYYNFRLSVLIFGSPKMLGPAKRMKD